MRGKDGCCAYPLVPAGITPAYAGKRAVKLRDAVDAEDHPRVCGEKLYASPSWITSVGSPPHVRGKATLLELFDPAVWSTPANAGKKSPMKSKGR